MATYNKTQLSTDPQILLKDLFCVGDFGAWAAPKSKDNIDWFTQKMLEETPDLNLKIFSFKFHFLEKYPHLFEQRIKLLITKGADISNLAYPIANINKPDILRYCLDLGANPNIPNGKGNLPLNRAIDRNRSTIATIILEHSSFDFFHHFTLGSKNQKELFYTLFDKGFNSGLLKIFKKDPELLLAQDSFGNTVFHYLDKITQKGKSKSKNLNEILLFCLDHLRTNGIYFNPNQANQRGETITGDFMKTAIITLNYNITNLDIPIINTHKSKNNIKL